MGGISPIPPDMALLGPRSTCNIKAVNECIKHRKTSKGKLTYLRTRSQNLGNKIYI